MSPVDINSAAAGFRGFAVECDLNGTVQSVLRNTIGLDAESLPGAVLARIIDPAGLQKYLSFLDILRRDSAAADWELNIATGTSGIPSALHFAGVRSADRLVIVATLSRWDIDPFLHELVVMSNEQTTTIRSVLKEKGRTDRMFEELSALNNEMAVLQRDLQKKNAQLEELNRTKNQFLGMAAHDLRNPLGSFSSLTDLLLEMLPNADASVRTIIEEMGRASNHMLALVNDLLDIAKIESGKLDLHLSTLDIAELVRHNIAIQGVRAAQRDIRIDLRIDQPPAGPIVADENKIEQVLNNLVSNAVKYSPRGTLITVRVEPEPSGVRISVADQGPGIPEKDLGRLFKPWGKTSVRPAKGEHSTGLGLLICRRIVEGHGGKIGVQSEPGKGSTFYFTLKY
jgi:signal transduction histidine kinase